MIPKAENTFEHKYNQAKCLIITTRGYIANNTNTEVKHWGSDIRSLKKSSEATEVRELALAGADSGGCCKKINSKRFPFCIQ